MARRDRRFAPVAVSLAVVLGLGAGLASEVGRPYPGFFFTIDYHIAPVEPAARAAGLRWGDRVVGVDGRARVRSATGPIPYEIERAGRRFTVELPPQPFAGATFLGHFAGYFAISLLMLAVGVAVYLQNAAALLGATKIEGRAGTRWTYTASGLTTNIAARLAAQAGDGEIVVSESTRRRLGPELPVEDLGVRELKNVDRPLRLFRLR